LFGLEIFESECNVDRRSFTNVVELNFVIHIGKYFPENVRFNVAIIKGHL